MNKFLFPSSSCVISSGALNYSQHSRARSDLFIKKSIRNEFPEFKDRSIRLKYRMEFYRQNRDEFLRRISEIVKNSEPLPILLNFYVDYEEQSKN